MSEARNHRLAELLVQYSIDCQPGDHVLIEATESLPLVHRLVEEVARRGGYPHVNLRNDQVTRRILLNSSEEQIRAWADADLYQMKKMNAYIGVRGKSNISELADVPPEKMKLYNSLYVQPVVFEQRVKHTKWVILRYPNPAFAQLANMSTEAFESFYFDVCTLDYAHMSEAMKPLKQLMDRTDRVRITGPGTDLTFSIKGIGSVMCDGRMNIPDGEVYSAPVKDSVNGKVTFNAPSPYDGFVFENISLTFENGKIVQASANDSERLNRILDTDEGARFVGEFSLGFHPHIKHPMKDILFDEKIDGSFHFTPGQCYDDAYNGNQSAIHWDLVCIQRPDYGGGEIWFDDRLIRKDGRFIIPELEGLNPEKLV
jgi:aminopeptidase